MRQGYYEEDSTHGVDGQDLMTPDHWIKRDSRLIRLTGSHPMNAEPPTHLLMNNLITPAPLHYVRSHGSVPKLDWDKHTLQVKGLVKEERQFSMDDISRMEAVSFPVTMVCDGNRRKELNMIRHTKGFNWGAGAVSTSNWKGARLRDLLSCCGVDESKGKYVWFEGADNLVQGHYGTSIPLEIALDPTCDVIVAYEMNGERLHPDHGYPIRIVIPGMVGGRQVKWLKTIVVSDKETDNFYHWHDNKVLPSNVDFSTVDSGGWWKKPEYTLYDLNINSIITHPIHGEKVNLGKMSNETEFYTVRGYAYSGGGRKINRVELSIDGGNTWDLCELLFLDESVRHGLKTWVWCHWEYKIPLWKFMKAKELVVRAWDRSCNTQPNEPTWNLLGMMNNSYYRVKVDINEIEEQDQYLEVLFAHPVQPNHMHGGWRDKTPIRPHSISIDRSKSHYTREEVMKHCWIILDNDVYDVTSYLKEHPGGSIPILLMANGTDASVLFREIHGEDAEEIKDRFCIGSLVHIPESMKSYEHAILDPSTWLDAELTEKVEESHDTKRFKFTFPEDTTHRVVGLPTGHHILLGADIQESFIARPYTPIYPLGNDDKGYLELLIKVYYDRKDKPGGIMSQYIDQLKIGDRVKIKGPAGHIHYLGRGVITVHSTTIKVNRISMIGGGTGITPLYQLAKTVLQDPNDTTKVALLYSNHSESDILLRSELGDMAKTDKRFTVWYTLSSEADKNWKFSVGRINDMMIREYLFPPSDDSIVLLCGPPAMIDHACIPHLHRLGFNESTIFEF